MINLLFTGYIGGAFMRRLMLFIGRY